MSLPAKVVLATGNTGKVKEFASLFAPLNIEVLPQSEFNVSSVPETGTTFVENAIIKARHAAQQTGLPAIADDSGLECSSSCERSLLVSMRSPVDERVTSRRRPDPKKLATDRSGRNTFALCGLGWTPSAASGAAPPRG